MSSEHVQIARSVLRDLLERWAFMFSQDADSSELPRTVINPILIHTAFTGSRNGSIALAAPLDFGAMIAATATGAKVQASSAKSYSEDALRELLSATCAHALSEIESEETEFNIGLPKSLPLDDSGWSKLIDDTSSLGILVGDHPAVLRMVLK